MEDDCLTIDSLEVPNNLSRNNGVVPLKTSMDAGINPRNNYDFIKAEDLHLLVISKPFDPECQEVFLQILAYLQKHEGITVYSNKFSLDMAVDENMIDQYTDKTLVDQVNFGRVKIFSDEDSKINRVITLGGDGTILFAIKNFYNRRMPPIISFGLGSVGYLCWFDSDQAEEVLYNWLIKERIVGTKNWNSIKLDDSREDFGEPYLQYKARLKVVIRPNPNRGKIQVESNIFDNNSKELPSGSQLNALNELTLESETFNSMLTVDVYLNGHFLSRVTLWGLIISTPTGSTAYNMSAGGSIVQTEVKAIWITPLNPATLSFRPLILPFDWNITIKVPEGVNDEPFNGCIDGDFKFKLMEGDELSIIGSEFPVPFVTNEKDDPIVSWINRLNSTVLSY